MRLVEEAFKMVSEAEKQYKLFALARGITGSDPTLKKIYSEFPRKYKTHFTALPDEAEFSALVNTFLKKEGLVILERNFAPFLKDLSGLAFSPIMIKRNNAGTFSGDLVIGFTVNDDVNGNKIAKRVTGGNTSYPSRPVFTGPKIELDLPDGGYINTEQAYESRATCEWVVG